MFIRQNSHSGNGLCDLVEALDIQLSPENEFAKGVMFLPTLVCLSLYICLSVCLLPTLLKKALMGFDNIFREGQKLHNDQLIRFWK